jgi:hypothetical protein
MSRGFDQILPYNTEGENVYSFTSNPSLCLRDLAAILSISFNILNYFRGWVCILYIVRFDVLTDILYRKSVLRIMVISI